MQRSKRRICSTIGAHAASSPSTAKRCNPGCPRGELRSSCHYFSTINRGKGSGSQDSNYGLLDPVNGGTSEFRSESNQESFWASDGAWPVLTATLSQVSPSERNLTLFNEREHEHVPVSKSTHGSKFANGCCSRNLENAFCALKGGESVWFWMGSQGAA